MSLSAPDSIKVGVPFGVTVVAEGLSSGIPDAGDSPDKATPLTTAEVELYLHYINVRDELTFPPTGNSTFSAPVAKTSFFKASTAGSVKFYVDNSSALKAFDGFSGLSGLPGKLEKTVQILVD